MTHELTDKSILSRRLLAALVTPLVLILATGSVLAWQLVRMSKDARWVDDSDEVLALTHDLETQILEQQTGLRGYLLTGDRSFLEPYERARPLGVLTSLRALVANDPATASRVDEVRRRFDVWSAEAVAAARGPASAGARSYDSLLDGKRHMDNLRTALTSVIDGERELRAQRAAAASASKMAARNVFVGLFLTSGLALAFFSRRQLSAVARTYGTALAGERAARASVEDEGWIRAGQAKIAEELQGELALTELGARLLRALVPLAGAEVGALFTAEAGGWRRIAGYGIDGRCAGPESFRTGEGLVGRAAEDRAVVRVRDVPLDFLKIRAGTGEAAPAELLLSPAVAEGATLAVVELAFLQSPSARARDLLARVGEHIALAVRSAEYRARMRELLEEAQRQAEELKAQQEELETANDELTQQRNVLSAARAELEERNHELLAVNAQLEQQSSALRHAQQGIAEQSAEVERASRYKSEFLANMSHELRTPLNSTLILAKLLADNTGKNLTDEQVRFAQTIYAAGNELLALINDVLDLSKIEAGKVDVCVESVSIEQLVGSLSAIFDPVARDKGLTFAVTVEDGAPRAIDTDGHRLKQILKNLVANALKFTETGGVSLRIAAEGDAVCFAVRDTGIGIPKDQHAIIFEAFRQADGATTRKFGGSGLGLTISRDLAHRLGGALVVDSEPGRGSTFTLRLPGRHARPPADAPQATPSADRAAPQLARASYANGHALRSARANGNGVHAARAPAVDDDRDRIDRSRPLALIVEDDVAFARIVRDLGREAGFQCLVAHDAESGLALAADLAPNAIVLDVLLPDHSGLSVLDRLKRNPATRHVPVHVVSAADHAQAALTMGAIGYLVKPVTRDDLMGAFRKLEDRLARRVRRLLIVEDDAVQRGSLIRLLGGDAIAATGVATVDEALEAMQKTRFDCVVTDLMLPGASGFDLLERIAKDEASAFAQVPPVIVYTGRSLSADEEQRLRKHSTSIIVKGARSPERLLDEVTLFLHQVESDLSDERRRMLEAARVREPAFEGRRVLVVEDDARNIFALSSVLEPRGVEVVVARNGREAIAALDERPRIDLVLMDIMMPEMDGLAAMREIRKRPAWGALPIIALTAKAMKDDQQRCRDAGANDYVAKPLDVDALLSLLRVWMPQ